MFPGQGRGPFPGQRRGDVSWAGGRFLGNGEGTFPGHEVTGFVRFGGSEVCPLRGCLFKTKVFHGQGRGAFPGHRRGTFSGAKARRRFLGRGGVLGKGEGMIPGYEVTGFVRYGGSEVCLLRGLVFSERGRILGKG